jgi:hypothetical protein
MKGFMRQRGASWEPIHAMTPTGALDCYHQRVRFLPVVVFVVVVVVG